jgi:copper(I)-binding protein
MDNFMRPLFRFARFVLATCLVLWLPFAASAQTVEVKDAWVRGTVPAQKVTGAFMEITGKSAVRLLSVDSPIAASVEIHNVAMQDGVMKMSPVDGVDVPAGKTVKLAPGGYHVMLTGLRQQMKAGDRVPLKLTFELADKKRESLELSAEVREITGSRAHAH